jgi:hypothetical protein
MNRGSISTVLSTQMCTDSGIPVIPGIEKASKSRRQTSPSVHVEARFCSSGLSPRQDLHFSSKKKEDGAIHVRSSPSLGSEEHLCDGYELVPCALPELPSVWWAALSVVRDMAAAFTSRVDCAVRFHLHWAFSSSLGGLIAVSLPTIFASARKE